MSVHSEYSKSWQKQKKKQVEMSLEVEPAEKHEELDGDEAEGKAGGRGTWKHGAFHIATTIATPAAYAPLPFALASLGWPLGLFLFHALSL